MRTIICILLLSFCYCDVEFSAGPRNFTIELLHYTQKQTGGHVVISPFGIWTLMAGLAVGATGESFDELRYAMRYFLFRTRSLKTRFISGYNNLTRAVLTQTTDGVSLTSKNFMFAANDFILKSVFKQTITKDFDVTIKVLDFKNSNEAAKKANSFIKDSGARVSNVLTSDDFNESRMILTNVISFKGLWTSQFKASDTRVENFYNENKEEIGKVNMMYQRGRFPLSSIVDLKAFACELTYGRDAKYSMIVILPHPGVPLEDTYKRLAYVTLPDITAQLHQDTDHYGLDEVEIKLPRFKIRTNAVMNKPLNDMGVYDIFDPDLASFKRMTNESIFVSAIVHKAYIEVSESGTVASAATAVYLTDRISSPPVIANRPFVYFIIEKSTTTVIFAGIYSKPTLY